MYGQLESATPMSHPAAEALMSYRRVAGPDLVPLFDTMDDEDDLVVPSLRSAGHRVGSALWCVDLDKLDPESTGALRDPTLQPALVYPDRQNQRAVGSVSTIRAKVAPAQSGAALPAEHELVEMDFITMEHDAYTAEAGVAAPVHRGPVLSTSRQRGRRDVAAANPGASDTGLVLAGVTMVGGMLGLFLMLFSGYGAI